MNWQDWILANELPIRLSFFFGIFAVMAIWEIISPRRILTVSKGIRWANNMGLVFLNSVVLRLLFPAAAVGVAALADQQGWGLINFYHLPFLAAAIISVVLMDFDLSATCDGPFPAGALAFAPGSPCRSRLRRHHRCALSHP